MVILAALEGDLTANLGNVNAKEEGFCFKKYLSIYLPMYTTVNLHPKKVAIRLIKKIGNFDLIHH